MNKALTATLLPIFVIVAAVIAAIIASNKLSETVYYDYPASLISMLF